MPSEHTCEEQRLARMLSASPHNQSWCTGACSTACHLGSFPVLTECSIRPCVGCRITYSRIACRLSCVHAEPRLDHFHSGPSLCHQLIETDRHATTELFLQAIVRIRALQVAQNADVQRQQVEDAIRSFEHEVSQNWIHRLSTGAHCSVCSSHLQHKVCGFCACSFCVLNNSVSVSY